MDFSHIVESEENDNEFIMFSGGESMMGKTLESKLSELNSKSVIGSKTKEILKTLGWRFGPIEYDQIKIDERRNSQCATDGES